MTSSRHHMVIIAALAMLPGALPAQAQGPDRGGDRQAPLTLHGAVQRALETHPALSAARAAHDAAGQAVGIATAERFPQLTVQAGLTRFEEPMIVAPLHGFDPARPPEFSRTLTGGALGFSYALFDGGARGARVAGAQADARAAAAALGAAESELMAVVARTYLAALSARDVLDAQRQGVAALEAERDRVQQLLAAGSAAQVQLLRVRAALAEAEAARVSAAAALDLAERGLARLLGVDAATTRTDRLAAVTLADTIPGERDDLLVRAGASNDRIEQARWRMDAARRDHRAAVAAWFPRLDVVGGYQGFGTTAEVTAEWQAGVRLSYALFAGGGRARRVAAATARQRAAEERLRLTELETAQAVDGALSAVWESRARVAAHESAVRHLTEVARIELLTLEAGAGTEADFLQAEAAARRARAALADVRHAEIGARVELARLTGELTPAWLTRVLENRP